MSSSFDFDRQITAWLDEQAPTHEPERLTDEILTRTRRMRQLPGWATLERWIPMETRYRFGAVPRTALILTILAVLLAVLSAIAVGQQPSPRLPPSLGVAKNGLIAFDDGGDIWVVNPDSTGRRQLTSGPAVDSAPAWSEDGTRIAYFSQDSQSGPTRIMVMDANGGHVRTLVTDVALSPVWLRVSWSHDGRYLAYSDTSTGDRLARNRIMVIPVAGGDPVEVASPGQDPTWSPDDRQIAYQSGGWNKDLKLIPQGLSVTGADGTDPRLIDGAATDNEWAYAYPQWDPDGQTLTYHTNLPGEAMHIYVAAADGGGIHAIDSQPSWGGWPVWSPDGTRIAYIGVSPAGNGWQIATMDPDGAHVLVLDHPPLACNCDFKWSPDGTKVLAYQDPAADQSDTGGSLMIIDADGKAPVLIIPIVGTTSQEMSWQRLAP